MPKTHREIAEETRRRILGDSYVNGRAAEASEFDAPFLDLILDGAWGGVWARDGLSARDRSLLTIALLAALGHWEEVAMHIRATENTGATPEEVREALLHVAVYAGVPAANHAIKIARDTYAEMGIEV